MTPMMAIKILSNSTINKIAAGEVIERPASVVKELVENSIDAGATKISVILQCAGKNLISIQDNGCGMDKEELALAIQRHATSKLDENDLLNITSFGFRGEALPSIGAISKFTITSRKSGAPCAYMIKINGGEIQGPVAASLTHGTISEVRDLFFATPARLKFLRSDKTELAACIAVIKRLALAHPDIHFHVTHDGKKMLDTEDIVITDDGSSHITPSGLSARIATILGGQFIDNATEVSLHRDAVKIEGYCSLPTYNKAVAEDQFLFINNRPVKDKLLNVALKIAYQDYLARDRHPVAILFITIDPQQVDVNVHPAKSEVRFHDPNLIKNLVISAIKDGLYASSNRVSTATAQAMLNSFKGVQLQSQPHRANSDNAGAYTPRAQSNNGNYNFQHQSNNYHSNKALIDDIPLFAKSADLHQYHASVLQESAVPYEVQMPYNNYDNKETKLDQEPYSESITSSFALGAACAQLYRTYILSQTENSIIITDQHAAHERLGYEALKKQLATNGIMKQRLLIPEIIEFDDLYKMEILALHAQNLSNLGLNFDKFAENAVMITEIPHLLTDIDIKKLVLDIADHLSASDEPIALTQMIEEILETYACYYAIRAGQTMNIQEMNALLRQMEMTPFSGQCNHGRQTYIELQLKDIEKLFGRR
jgi:DNA mismatch repair protein MutL